MLCTLTSRCRPVEMKGKSERERAGYDMVDSRSSNDWLFRDGDQPALEGRLSFKLARAQWR